MSPPLGLGIAGAGRFAGFIADAVADLGDVAVRAVADPATESATDLAARHQARATPRWEDLLEDDSVDVVVVATPPSSHAAIAVAALEAGKHVFCEKPVATTAADAADLVEAVRRTGRVLVVDHVLRYNPLLRALKRLEGQLLGGVQRFCFENDASDEDLGPGHWFWDRSLSGGIFVEHGVHFFDAAAMMTGRPATAVTATAARRPDGRVDMVSATAAHGDDVLASHLHSFAHAHRCERQLMRLDYGPAEARVEGWIPVHAVVDAWTDDVGASLAETLPSQTAELMHVDGFRLGPRAHIDVAVDRDAARPEARGRGVPLEIPHRVRIDLTLGGPAAKAEAYAESVRAAMADLVSCVTGGATPFSGVAEGAAAVAVATAATRSADQGTSETLPHLGTGSP